MSNRCETHILVNKRVDQQLSDTEEEEEAEEEETGVRSHIIGGGGGGCCCCGGLEWSRREKVPKNIQESNDDIPQQNSPNQTTPQIASLEVPGQVYSHNMIPLGGLLTKGDSSSGKLLAVITLVLALSSATLHCSAALKHDNNNRQLLVKATARGTANLVADNNSPNTNGHAPRPEAQHSNAQDLIVASDPQQRLKQRFPKDSESVDVNNTTNTTPVQLERRAGLAGTNAKPKVLGARGSNVDATGGQSVGVTSKAIEPPKAKVKKGTRSRDVSLSRPEAPFSARHDTQDSTSGFGDDGVQANPELRTDHGLPKRFHRLHPPVQNYQPGPEQEHSFVYPIEETEGGQAQYEPLPPPPPMALGPQESYKPEDQSAYANRIGTAPPGEAIYLQESSEKRPSQIKVVFNNNPHFIIGRESQQQGNQLAESLSALYRGKKPHGDEYSFDESKLEETKIFPAKDNNHSDQPCTKDNRGSKHPPDQISQGINQGGQQSIFDDGEKSPIPQVPKQPNVGASKQLPPSGQQRPVQEPEDEQVITPIEQMIKSGLRPPLRMIISMRNKNGDTMKVPINLQGATKQVKVPTIDLGPQMQIRFEQQEVVDKGKQGDENTPTGGDIFDPSLIKIFKRTKTQADEQTHVEIQQPTKSGKTPQVPQQQQQQVVEEEPMPAKAPILPKSVPPKRKLPDSVKQQQQQTVVEDQQQQEEQQRDEPQVIDETPPVKEMPRPEPQMPQVKGDQQQQVQQQVQEQTKNGGEDCRDSQQKLDGPEGNKGFAQPPAGGDVTNYGTFQMTLPPVNAFQNQTITSMMAHFQKVLGEMVSKQRTTAQLPVGNPHLLPQHPQPQQQQHHHQQQQQQQQDDQEDLMVAMLAANMSSNPDRQLSMTVIKPPKGTSLQDAIREHANPSVGNPSRTVAILQSIKPLRRPRVQNTNGPPSDQPGRPANMVDMSAVAVEVKLRQNDNPTPATMGGSLATQLDRAQPEEASEFDPDGFTSGTQVHSFRSPWKREPGGRELKLRFRRSINHIDNYAGYYGGSQLEPNDKLASQANLQRHDRMQKGQFPAGKFGRFESTRLGQPATKVKASPVTGGGGWMMDRNTIRPRAESLLGAASEQSSQEEPDEAAEPDDEPEGGEESQGSSGSAEPRSSDPDVDDDSNDLGEDASDEAANFDSDDEPYNQVASSERDYNNPSTFEIPQIDINPDTLKQKGCRTVLREVQEIPMNGLGVVQANGKPGSGYGGGGGRHKRQVNNDKLLNSRKVTSIVMTKECHFPNDVDQQDEHNLKSREPSRKQQAPSGYRQQIAPIALESRGSPHYRIIPPDAGYQHNFHQQQLPLQRPNVNHAPVTVKRQDVDESLGGPYQNINIGRHLDNSQRLQPAMSHAMSINRGHPPESGLGRRQVMMPQSTNQAQASYALQPMPARFARDIYMGSDSKRDEVVAQKLYKPPSDDDPYHTLSYSSKNGADPDMDLDEDDSVMDSGDGFEGDTVGPQPDSRRSAASNRNRQRSRDTLSESERQALLDPNHEDTDPPAPGSRQFDLNEEPSGQPASDDDDQDHEGDADEPKDESRKSSTGVPQARASSTNGRQQPRNGQSPPTAAAAGKGRAGGDGKRFGKSFKFEHESLRPQGRGLATQLSKLKPGRQEFADSTTGSESDEPPARKTPSERRREAERRNMEAADDRDDEGDEDEDDGARNSPKRKSLANAESSPAADQGEEEPDVDPDYNLKEGQIPAHTKPKKVEKSFAYVHRDVPRKGDKNPDDFVVSYGRGNFQTEHEDYDSDREVPLQTSVNNSKDPKNQEASAPRPVAVTPPPAPAQSRGFRGYQWLVNPNQGLNPVNQLVAAVRAARARRNLEHSQTFA